MSSQETREESSTDDNQTCDSCGEPFSHSATAGPGRSKRSCGCDVVLSPVADDTPNAFSNVAIRALNLDGDVETAADVHEGARDRLVADGGQFTVGMLELDPSAEVHLTGHNGGGRQRVHTDPDCRHLDTGKTTTSRCLEDLPADWPVCQTCLGIARADREPTTDPLQTREDLLAADPEELGLSPLDERRDEDLVTDGGHDPVVCDHCGTRVPFQNGSWISVSVSPHGSNDRDDSFAASVCGDCGQDVVEALGVSPEVIAPATQLASDGGVPETLEDLAGTCESCGDDIDPDRLIEGECPGCHYRPATDGGVVQESPSPAMPDDAEAIVARGGATTTSDLHTDPNCPSLQNAIETRPATDSEIQSYSWCENCIGEPERGNQDWSAYRAAVNAGSNGGDGE